MQVDVERRGEERRELEEGLRGDGDADQRQIGAAGGDEEIDILDPEDSDEDEGEEGEKAEPVAPGCLGEFVDMGDLRVDVGTGGFCRGRLRVGAAGEGAA